VAASAASLPELVGDAGELVDVDDPRALAGAMGRLMTDPARRRDLTERGLARARRFAWDTCAQRLVDIYRAATERR
jgi:glycosyltransferase involved in cell wall biosynthesis